MAVAAESAGAGVVQSAAREDGRALEVFGLVGQLTTSECEL